MRTYLYLTSIIVLLGACSNEEEPVALPSAVCVLQREFHHRLAAPTPNGDTASVVRATYSTPDVAATASVSPYHLTINLTCNAPQQQVQLLVPTTVLSTTWVGTYVCQPFAINRPAASMAFWTDTSALSPILSTTTTSLSSGEIRILAYDARTHLLRGTYRAQQPNVVDPTAPATADSVQKNATIVITGSFENLLVQ